MKIQFDPVDQDVVKARLERNPATNTERAAALHKMFEEAGCTGAMLTDQEVSGGRQPNVICTTGEGSSTIVIGAHFDFDEIGKGAVENWSGASLLPSLFQALRDNPRRHKLVFIGFSDREKGRRGSNFYLKNLSSDDKSKIKAMINIEGLGLTPTKIQMDSCDKALSQKMASIAKSMNFKVGGYDNPLVSESDQRTFFEARIPVISVHSLYGDGKKIPGTVKDTTAAIQMNDYYESYKLLSAYLAYVDQSME